MKKVILVRICIIIQLFGAFCLISNAFGSEKEWRPTHEYFDKHKKMWDDPRAFFKVHPIKSNMPTEEYSKLVRGDLSTVKAKWAEVTGFTSPDIVGKIAPEIKPGKYTLADKEKYPGFKELMIPLEYETLWRKPGPPVGFAFTEFEVVPTTQCYMRLNLAEQTLKYKGKSKLDDNGYLIEDTYVAGIPFPNPSGKFKAQQIMYNWKKRSFLYDQAFMMSKNFMGDKNLNKAAETYYWNMVFKLSGRCDVEPFGYMDDRAKEKGESRSYHIGYLSPRDQAGNVIWTLLMNGAGRTNKVVMWLAEMRRLRRLSGTDSQDTYPGSNYIYDDLEFFVQNLDPNIYPYEFNVLEEREFLVPSVTWDGAEYVAKENMERKNVRMQRRPMWVVELKQLDPDYIYSKRILYIDKETYMIYLIQNYDQEGRLWRYMSGLLGYYEPEIPLNWNFYLYNVDVIDPQSEFELIHWLPVPYMERKDVGIRNLKKFGK